MIGERQCEQRWGEVLGFSEASGVARTSSARLVSRPSKKSILKVSQVHYDGSMPMYE